MMQKYSTEANWFLPFRGGGGEVGDDFLFISTKHFRANGSMVTVRCR